jgi:aryl-alcohol dehydrogenase-like predicted oxidoreductase
MVELVLGTAQLGLDYGITNQNGRPSDAQAIAMLEQAKSGGIRTLDTAEAYGDAELRLGDLGFASQFNVISKFSCEAEQNLSVDAHLKRLNLSCIEGLLFHSALHLTTDFGISSLNQLRAAKRSGLVKKIGFSAYTLSDIQNALSVFPDADIIQVPANALDFRILDSDLASKLIERGTEIHARSVFLQGLLLERDTISMKFKKSYLTETLDKIDEASASSDQSVLQYLLNQVRNHPNVSAVVAGVSSMNELSQIIEAWNCPPTLSKRIRHNLDYEKLDPRNW